MDRRTSLKWIVAASATLPTLRVIAKSGGPSQAGYGSDPALLKPRRPGEWWPLTMNGTQRRTAGVLADIIIPADEVSPSASQVGVVDFLDEWISAPYPAFRADKKRILDGFSWLDAEAVRRSKRTAFVDLDVAGQRSICDAICNEPKALPNLRRAAQFFARFRDLTAGGFYTTPIGRNDLGYIGNVPRTTFEPMPRGLLQKLGLA